MRDSGPWSVGLVIGAAMLGPNSAPGRAAPTERAPSLRLKMTTPKQTVLQDEEVPVLISIVNTGPGRATVRTGGPRVALDIRLAEADSGHPLRPSYGDLRLPLRHGGRASQSDLKAPPRVPLLAAPGAPGTRPAAKKVTRLRPAPPPAVDLVAGEKADADFELTWLYGSVPCGRYRAQAVLSVDGEVLASPPVSLEVRAVPAEEGAAHEALRRVREARTDNEGFREGNTFLERFPHSAYAPLVRRETLQHAAALKQWPTVVELGQATYTDERWSRRKEVAGMYLARGLWHTGKREEAEKLLSGMARADAAYLLKRLRDGADD